MNQGMPPQWAYGQMQPMPYNPQTDMDAFNLSSFLDSYPESPDFVAETQQSDEPTEPERLPTPSRIPQVHG